MEESESESFEFRALEEVEAEAIFEAKVEKFVIDAVSYEAVPLDALARNLSK